MSIATKNAMPIRPKMDVYAGLADYDVDFMDLTITIQDPSTSTILETFTWPTADPGAYAFGYDITPTGGMYQSWQNFNIRIDEDDGDEIPRIFFLCDTVGGWTVRKDNGAAQPVKPIMLFNIGDNVATLKFEKVGSVTNQNIRVWAVVPCSGNSFAFGNDDLTHVNADLAANLDVWNPSFEVSTIEASAYVPGLDLSELANMPEKVPIVYMAGYNGDEMSFPRFFYLTDSPEYEDNILTFSGEDASAALEAFQVPAQVLTSSASGNGLAVYYSAVKEVLTGAGIALANAQADPPTYSTGNAAKMIIKAQTGREFIADMMATCRYSIDQTGNVLHDFLPAFVDAGRPVLRWEYYDADMPDYGPFDIYESDVGDLERKIDQNVKTIKSEDDYGLRSTVSDATGSSETIATVAVRAGKKYSKTFQEYYRGVSVTRSTTPRKYTAQSANWTAASAGNSVVSGILEDIEVDFTSVNNSAVDRGREIVYAPKIYGEFRQLIDSDASTQQLGYVPNYYHMFNQDPEHGSFTWRGNPLMQPRDPFYFHRMDESIEVCTVERIELTHEDGGTVATVHYRKGVC